ncbi:MAG: dephospho-CoA kinase [Cycloclasticus pugetii]|jgi:dephospho-CoA kinase|uniref:dephospho-CoA kinase n=1 Tax=Cycloclasticus pugetii TaxID=34068 RepID=UPI0039E2C8A3
MLTIGLTGGIGCGKSTVTQLFEKRNVPVVDADIISHTIVQSGQPALLQLQQAFGDSILLPSGALNRDYLRDLIFNNPSKKETLESILHPIIYKTMYQTLASFDYPYGILSIPLLLETKHQANIDRILVIDCPEATQIKRVKARDQLSDSMINSIMNAQCTRAFRLSQADDIITNVGSLNSLEKKVEQLHNFYLEMSAGKTK